MIRDLPEVGDRGLYAQRALYDREVKTGVRSARWGWTGFVCVTHYEGKAVIRSDSGHFYQRGNECVFDVHSNDITGVKYES